jgi:hypothetical protein
MNGFDRNRGRIPKGEDLLLSRYFLGDLGGLRYKLRGDKMGWLRPIYYLGSLSGAVHKNLPRVFVLHRVTAEEQE